jgi:hypothetical protein
MPPSILLSLTIATACGSAAHALFGRRIWQWPIYWGAALVGFFGGYIAGVALRMDIALLGSVPMLPALAGAVAMLVLTWYFTTPTAHEQSQQEGELRPDDGRYQ